MAEEQAKQVAQDVPEHENHRKKPDRPNNSTQDLSAKVSIKDLHPTVLWLPESDDTVTSGCRRLFLGQTLFIDRHTTAEEVTVAVDVVDPTDHRPELVLSSPWCRVGSRLARIASIPVIGEKILCRVRRTLQDVIFPVRLPGFNCTNFAVDRYHGVAEAIQFSFRFALGRFNH